MLLAWTAALAAAKCGYGGIAAAPPDGALAADGEIVLVARDHDRQRVRAIPDLALVAGDDRVPLERVATLEGSFDTTQLVLRPTRPLAAGRTYALPLGDRVVGEWTATAAPPAGPPVWRAAPEVVGRERQELGCGPAVAVRVAVDVAGAAWIEATVWPVAGGPRAVARLPVLDGEITLGHGMCAGDFALEADREYFADLVAVDAEGRRARADDSPVRFTAP